MLARFPVPFLSRLRSHIRPSRQVVGLARDINFERCIVSVIGENPIAGISTIENVKDHSLPPALGTLFVVCQREDPTKTQSVNEQLDLSLPLRLNFAGQ